MKLDKKFVRLVKYYLQSKKDLRVLGIHMTLKEFKAKVDSGDIGLYEDGKRVKF